MGGQASKKLYENVIKRVQNKWFKSEESVKQECLKKLLAHANDTNANKSKSSPLCLALEGMCKKKNTQTYNQSFTHQNYGKLLSYQFYIKKKQKKNKNKVQCLFIRM